MLNFPYRIGGDYDVQVGLSSIRKNPKVTVARFTSGYAVIRPITSDLSMSNIRPAAVARVVP
jgi:hypothetical protein